jgi:hypothetical protein
MTPNKKCFASLNQYKIIFWNGSTALPHVRNNYELNGNCSFEFLQK